LKNEVIKHLIKMLSLPRFASRFKMSFKQRTLQVTIPGLIIINLLAGASAAFGAKVQIRNLQRPVFYNRYFSALMLLEVLILLPVGIYFCGFYPDWSWMYLIDTQQMPFALSAMAIVAYPVAATMGYLVGYFSARGNSDWVTLMFMAFLFLGIVGIFIVSGDKILFLGTFEQYHRNVGLEPIASTTLLLSIILCWSGLIPCWGYLFYRFFREGRLLVAAKI